MPSSRGAIAAGSALLLLRGVALWLVVPIATCVWIVLAAARRRPAGLGQFVGWVDLNLTAGLQRTALRPFFAAPARWTPWSEVCHVTHRVRWFDPA
jgi:hypothetical protein